MENISVMIWNELCRFVGTEEKVVIRRRKCELSDLIFNRGNTSLRSISCISSGSQAEGLSLPGSDIDAMFVYNNISVSCSDNVPVSDSDIIMDITYIKPGFVRLYCRDIRVFNHNRFVLSAVTESDQGLLLSSLLFRDAIVDLCRKIIPSAVGHGPCSTFALPFGMENDLLLCFSCKTWPVVANEWIDRYRNNNWPPCDLITEIKHDGCLIVPIGNPHSDDSHMQWRISFSTAEKKLVHSMNHSQFLCYGLLKLYLKHVINANTDVKDLLCSYFLKTSLFYCMEDEQIVWNKENFLDCFWTCLRRLIKWVRDEYCPNFFIKENNMFEAKVCGKKSRILLRYLNELYQEGLYSLFRIPCLSALHITTINRPVLTGEDLTDAEREYFCDQEIFRVIFSVYSDDVNKCIRSLVVNAEMIETSTNSIDIPVSTLNYNQTMTSYVQGLYKQILTIGSNKVRYKQMKNLKSFILHNCIDTDRKNGMLLLATLCYLNSDYQETVTIVQKSLKKLKSCTFYCGRSRLYVYNQQAYIDGMCGKGLTLNQKLACDVFAQSYLCWVDFKMYPSEIERELLQHSMFNKAYINPWVYCYVLLFLSYLHTNSRNNMCSTLCELYATVDDRNLVPEPEAQLSISLLVRCIQLCESWQHNHRDR